MKIPRDGLTPDAVLQALDAFRHKDVPWRDGRTWAYVYDAGEAAEAITKQAYMSYLSENALDPTVFPSVLKLETDLVKMMAHHLNAPSSAVGNFTSGGTESIFCAVKAARDHFRHHHPDAGRAQIILPDTAHAAFHKAAHYLDLEVVLTPTREDFTADPAATADAITDRTALLVASACSYAHGVVDPVEDFGALAQERGLLLHVDGCMGGFLLPYFSRLGMEVPCFDFRVPGVTSLSVDLHKYAFAAKGASIILYRDKALRKHQIYACAGWTGYTIVNNTVQSSKSAGPMAGAWAVLHSIGDSGYLALAKTMFDATAKVRAGVEAIDGLYVLGDPKMNLIAVASDTVDVFHVVDELRTRGWFIHPQLAFGRSPKNFHLSVNPKSKDNYAELLVALAESVDAARALPSGHVADALGSLFGPNQAATPEVFQALLGFVGVRATDTGGIDLPDRMAGVNEALNAMPVPLREQLLTEFINDLYI